MLFYNYHNKFQGYKFHDSIPNNTSLLQKFPPRRSINHLINQIRPLNPLSQPSSIQNDIYEQCTFSLSLSHSR